MSLNLILFDKLFLKIYRNLSFLQKRFCDSLILSILTFFVLSSTANAKYVYGRHSLNHSGIYIGADFIHSYSSHKYLSENTQREIDTNGYQVNKEANGFGVSTGYKLALYNSFVAPEIFYDYLKNSAKEFTDSQEGNSTADRLILKDRYGIRLNVGHNLFSHLNIFVNAGVSNVAYKSGLYDDRYSSDEFRKTTNVKLVPIYGAGLSFDFTKNFQIRLSYDWQQFIVRYTALETEKDRVLLQTTKIGFAYKF